MRSSVGPITLTYITHLTQHTKAGKRILRRKEIYLREGISQVKEAAGARQRVYLQEGCCRPFSGWMLAELDKFSILLPKLGWTSSWELGHQSWWANDTCESNRHHQEVLKISCPKEPLWGQGKRKSIWDMWSQHRNWGPFMKVSQRAHDQYPGNTVSKVSSY